MEGGIYLADNVALLPGMPAESIDRCGPGFIGTG
jgi:hypothetical protein